VWKGPSIVATTGGIEKLRDFCSSEGVNEIYISISSHGKPLEGANSSNPHYVGWARHGYNDMLKAAE